MPLRPVALVCGTLALAAAFACGSSSTGPNGGSNPGGHLYVANGQHDVLVFALPLTDTSHPVTRIDGDTTFNPVGVAADTAGDVMVCDASNWIYRFDAPVDSASKPADSVKVGGTCGFMAFGPDHRLYVAEQDNYVLAFTPPITSASVPDTVATQATDALGVTFDRGNRLYVAQGTGGVQGYASPYVGGPLFTVDTAFSPSYGIAVDAAGDLVYADNNNRKIFIYRTPLSDSSVAADSIVSGLAGPFSIALGPDGTLYVTNGTSILGFTSVTSSSTPVVTLAASAGVFGPSQISVAK